MVEELTASAKALKEAYIENAKKQTKLNAADIYWEGTAFKASILKEVKVDFNACPEIVVEEQKLKVQALIVKATRSTYRPISVVKDKAAKDGFKLLCEAIIEPNSKRDLMAGVSIKDVQTFKQAYEQIVLKATNDLKAKIEAQTRAAQPAAAQPAAAQPAVKQ